jgi:hypothetical protein
MRYYSEDFLPNNVDDGVPQRSQDSLHRTFQIPSPGQVRDLTEQLDRQERLRVYLHTTSQSMSEAYYRTQSYGELKLTIYA